MLYERRMWIIGIGFALLLSACDSGQIFHRLRPNSVILAFGDGLTFGSGTEQGSSYPAQLENLIRRKVVNAGVAGESSDAGAARLPGALAEHEPDLVILGYGEYGLGRKLDRQQLQNDLRRMFEAANQRGIPVMMIAVPHPEMAANGVDLFEELAKELKVPLIHAALGDLLMDRKNEDEPVDGNANDYRKLADAVAYKLQELSAI